MKKTVLLAFVFLLFSTAVVVGFVGPIVAEGPIYIRSDGSVEGTDRIQRNENIYTFTENIKGYIVIEKDKIVIDGAGYTLHGNGNSGSVSFQEIGPEIGIDLYGIGVTIQNLHVENFLIAINHAVNATITQNYVEHNDHGITQPSNTTITKNYIANNNVGIYGPSTINQNNAIVENIITNNLHGIHFMMGSNCNFITKNKITENHISGITFTGSGSNFVLENEITTNKHRPSEVPDLGGNITIGFNTTTIGYGISFVGSQNNRIIGNNITSNRFGLFFGARSNDNVFYDNNFDNQQQVYIGSQRYGSNGGTTIGVLKESWDNGSRGNFWSDYTGTDADGDGIGDTPYIIDVNNQDNCPLILPDDYFQESSINSYIIANAELVGSYVEIKGAFINDGIGVSFAPLLISYSIDNSNSWHDITSVNTDAEGNYSAIWLPSATGNYQIKVSWEGNATIPKTSAIVNLEVTATQADNLISISSNSTITNFTFDTNKEEIAFNVNCPSNTTGYVRIYVSKTLFQNITQVNVYLDGTPLNCTASSTDDSWILYFVYPHSTHSIIINLSATVKQFNHSVVWFAAATVAAALISVGLNVYFKKRYP